MDTTRKSTAEYVGIAIAALNARRTDGRWVYTVDGVEGECALRELVTLGAMLDRGMTVRDWLDAAD